jgi:type VI protein secretion system component VasF
VRAARFLPPLLAAATLLLLGANALPTVRRKHRIRAERARVLKELHREQGRAARLRAEVEALAQDAFCVERMLLETWHETPPGAIPFDPAVALPPAD